MVPLYLSRLALNAHHGAVRADLSDCAALHRTVLRAFPVLSAPDAAPPSTATGIRRQLDVLYRVESNRGRPGVVTLLVQSGVEPSWAHLLPGYLASLPEGTNPACKRVDGLYAGLHNGMVLTFRLRANPTRKIDTHSGPNGERRNGRRVPLQNEEALLAWVRRKGEQHGFGPLATTVNPNVADVRASAPGSVSGRRGTAAEADAGRRLTFTSVLFEGRLRVIDAGALREALMHGVGSGKAFGFGLLSVAPGR
jgi:CRISPR system Cascade subunit CasE